MKTYMSIGPFCNIKYQINKHKGPEEYYFFDSMGICIKSVIKVLSCNDINDILNDKCFTSDVSNDSCAHLFINTLPNCKLIHDVPVVFNDNDIKNCVEKYIRRYYRTIEKIKKSEYICLMHGMHISDEDKIQLENVLDNMAKKYLVICIIESKEDKIIKREKFIDIYCNVTYDSNDWTKSYIDWKKIFETIDSL